VTRDALALVGCNALFLLAGAGVTRALGVWRTPRGLLRGAGLAYLAGLAAVGVALQLLLVLGVRFGVVTVVATTLVLAGTGLLRRSGPDPAPVALRPSRFVAPQMGVVAGMVVLMAVDLWFQPLGKWDAWAQWTAKARVIYLFHGLMPSILSTPPYYAMNPDYPTLLPAVEAADFSFAGRVDTQVIHLQFWLLYAATIWALVQLLTPRGRVIGWSVAALVAVTPEVQVLTASALADIPVAVFFAFAGLHARRWLDEDDGVALRLYALFAAAALATKFEGRIYVAALAVVLLAQLVFGARRRLLPAAAASAVALVGIVPWSLWASHNHVRGIFVTSLRDRLSPDLFSHVGRIPLTLGTLLRDVATPGEWLLPASVVVAAAVVAYRSRSSRPLLVFVGGTLLLCTAGLVLVYWATPLDPTWHLRQSGTRVIAGPLLFATFLVPALLGGQSSSASREAAAATATAIAASTTNDTRSDETWATSPTSGGPTSRPR
jgi:hypothetical protein